MLVIYVCSRPVYKYLSIKFKRKGKVENKSIWFNSYFNIVGLYLGEFYSMKFVLWKVLNVKLDCTEVNYGKKLNISFEIQFSWVAVATIKKYYFYSYVKEINYFGVMIDLLIRLTCYRIKIFKLAGLMLTYT